MIFDSTIHLGDVITTGMLGAIAWGLKRSISSATTFIQRVDHYDGRIESTAERVDLHSDVLVKSGWAKGLDLTPVSRKRRRRDWEIT